MTGGPQPGAPTRAVLSVNAGSSSLKFAVYGIGADGVGGVGLTGVAEGLEPGGQATLAVKAPGGDLHRRPLVARADDRDSFDAALRAMIAAVADEGGATLAAVAHRVVHGGSRYAASIVIDDEALAALDALVPLAPLHQPHNLSGVRAFRRALPGLPQVACFDTAFHATVPEREQRFALPESFYRTGIRRYGFHGLSYRYVAGALARTSERAAAGRVLFAHLGNGASLCAVRAGKSVATTMGFSALDGLVMGTRSGAIDAGVLLHLLRQGWELPAIEQLLYKQSGLLGVSGISADMRTLRASGEPAAALAIELFTHRIVRESGALAASMGGVDAIGFTGGIGENDAQLRADVCAALGLLGVRLDERANRELPRGGTAPARLHAADSAVEVWVVPTDEGRVAVADAVALLGLV